MTGDLVQALDRMIDVSMYVSDDAKQAALENRVLSLGVQGMSDAMSLMNIGFEDDRFRVLNR